MTSRYFQTGGGLGDILNDTYQWGDYAQMQAMRNPDEAIVSLVSHNPHVVELFQHWPEGPKLKVNYHAYDDKFWNPAFRARNRLPRLPVKLPRRSAPITFHSHPSDKDALDQLPDEYVVFSVSAGQLERNVPDKIVSEISAMGDRKTVFVGRDYERNGWGNHHREEKFWTGYRSVTLINRLSIPATVNVIRDPRCKGVVTAHSAMCLVAGWEKKPTLLLYPEQVRRTHFLKPDTYSRHAINNTNAFHGTLDQWQPLAEQFFTHIQ